MIYFKHLEDVKESYFTHLKSALGISFNMLKGSIMVFIHAFYPDIFESSGSNICREIVILVDNKKK